MRIKPSTSVEHQVFQKNIEHSYYLGRYYCFQNFYIGLFRFSKAVAVVLGNPSGSSPLQASLQYFKKKHPNCLFLHIDTFWQKTLSKLGFTSLLIGHEHEIELQQFHPTAKSHPRLIKNIKRAQQKELIIEEITAIDCDILTKLQKEWLEQKQHKHFHSFINNPFTYTQIPSTRCFVAKLKDHIVSLRFFTPLYKNNQLMGYTANSCFYSHKAPANTQSYLLYTAAKYFQKEGFKSLNLGLSPLDRHCIRSENKPFKKAIKLISKLALYPFLNTAGIECFKRQFKAQPKPIYIAYNNFWAFLGNLWALNWTLHPKKTDYTKKP